MPASAGRMRGAAFSSSGPVVPVVMRVRQRGTTLVGRVRCKGPCLARRYRMRAHLALDGIYFTGTLTSRRSECRMAGYYLGHAMEGSYRCLRTD